MTHHPQHHAIPALAAAALLAAACADPTRPPARAAQATAPEAIVAAADATLTCPSTRVTITDLGALPGFPESQANAINDRGEVVGFSSECFDFCTLGRAFLWTRAGGMRSLGLPRGAIGSSASDINNDGQVVGTFVMGLPEGCPPGFARGEHAFRWTARGGFEDLGTLGPIDCTAWSSASGVNNRGEVVGSSSPVAEIQGSAVLWTSAGEIQFIVGASSDGISNSGATAINDRSQVVGNVPGFDGSQAFVWTAQDGARFIGAPPGFTESVAFDMNIHGQVVGFAFNFFGDLLPAFRWSAAGGFENLGTLPGGNGAEAHGINDRGQVAGFGGVADPVLGFTVRAFIWTPASGMQELGTLPGGTDSRGYGINNLGQIVGRSTTSAGVSHAVLWTLPRTPAEQTQDLAAQVNALVSSGALRRVHAPPLLAKLDAARRSLDSTGQPTPATRGVLGAFVNQVEALVRTGRLSSTAGESLVSAAQCVSARPVA